MYWGKFSKAVEDLEKLKDTSKWRAHRVCLDALVAAEKFYVPECADVATGRRFDFDTKRFMCLPFDATAVLYDTWINEENGTQCQKTWCIAIGVDLSGPTNNKLRIAPPRQEAGWLMMSLIYSQEDRMWLPLPAVTFCEFPYDQDGFVIKMFSDGQEDAFAERLLNDFRDDAHALQNLCLLLSLNNVKKKDVLPPSKLNSARERRGKLPLHSYKVLVVDGETWSGEPSQGNGIGFRSHMRRGHIRRLGNGGMVWVSQCFVRGKIPGFADKVYDIRSTSN